MYCCLLALYCFCLQAGNLKDVKIQLVAEDSTVIATDTAHMQDVQQTWNQALTDICLLA